MTAAPKILSALALAAEAITTAGLTDADVYSVTACPVDARGIRIHIKVEPFRRLFAGRPGRRAGTHLFYAADGIEWTAIDAPVQTEPVEVVL